MSPIIPSDETGFSLTTLHDFQADPDLSNIAAISLAVSPDERYIYFGYNSEIQRLDTTDWSWAIDWAPLPAGNSHLATDSDGNIYAVVGTTHIVKITSGGAVTDPWVTIPGTVLMDISMGSDGALYVLSGSFGQGKNIYQVTLAGVVSEDVFMRLSSGSTNGYYTAIAVDSAGSVIALFGNPPLAGGNRGVNTTAHRHDLDPAIGLSTDDSVFAASVGNWFSGSGFSFARVTSPAPVAGSYILRMTTIHQASTPEQTPVLGVGNNSDPYFVDAGDVITFSMWLRSNAGNHDPGNYEGLIEIDVYGPTGSSLTSFDTGYIAIAEGSWTQFTLTPTMPAGAKFVSLSATIRDAINPHNVFDGDLFYVSNILANLRHPGTLTEIPLQSLVDSSADDNSEAKGRCFFDDQDHLLVPMTTFQGDGFTTPHLSWFLSVAPDGTATRIASTWDYGGSPSPAATATNIADGQLGTSLACEADSGAGISIDGKTLYFVDDGDQNNGISGNLLRVLKKSVVYPFYFRYKIRDVYDQYSANWSPIVGGDISPGGGVDTDFLWPNGYTLASGLFSQRWYPVKNFTLKGVSVSLTSAGASTTTVEVSKNGTPFATINLPAGQNYISQVLNPRVSMIGKTDYLQARVTAVGAGASGLDIEVEV